MAADVVISLAGALPGKPGRRRSRKKRKHEELRFCLIVLGWFVSFLFFVVNIALIQSCNICMNAKARRNHWLVTDHCALILALAPVGTPDPNCRLPQSCNAVPTSIPANGRASLHTASLPACIARHSQPKLQCATEKGCQK